MVQPAFTAATTSSKPLTVVVIDSSLLSESALKGVLNYARLAKEIKDEDVVVAFPPLLHAEACFRGIYPPLVPYTHRGDTAIAKTLLDPDYAPFIYVPHLKSNSPAHVVKRDLREQLSKHWDEILGEGKAGSRAERRVKNHLRDVFQEGEVPEKDLEHFPDLDRPLRDQLDKTYTVFALFADKEIRHRIYKFLPEDYMKQKGDDSIVHFVQEVGDGLEFGARPVRMIVATKDNLLANRLRQLDMRSGMELKVGRTPTLAKQLNIEMIHLHQHLVKNPEIAERDPTLNARLDKLAEQVREGFPRAPSESAEVLDFSKNRSDERELLDQ